MIDSQTLLTILMMAAATTFTRFGGYIIVRNLALSPRAIKMFEAAPGCVIISLIAPLTVSEQPANLLAFAVTAIAALRLSLFPTVLIGMTSAAILRHFLI